MLFTVCCCWIGNTATSIKHTYMCARRVIRIHDILRVPRFGLCVCVCVYAVKLPGEMCLCVSVYLLFAVFLSFSFILSFDFVKYTHTHTIWRVVGERWTVKSEQYILKYTNAVWTHVTNRNWCHVDGTVIRAVRVVAAHNLQYKCSKSLYSLYEAHDRIFNIENRWMSCCVSISPTTTSTTTSE